MASSEYNNEARKMTSRLGDDSKFVKRLCRLVPLLTIDVQESLLNRPVKAKYTLALSLDMETKADNAASISYTRSLESAYM